MNKQHRSYTVTVTPVGYVAGRSGTADELEFSALNANDAISQARSYMRNYCGWSSADGKLKYSARLTDTVQFVPAPKSVNVPAVGIPFLPQK